MRIIAISRVRNEADVIEAFVRHTAEHVDAHLILDNVSTDGTDEILRALRDEGVPIQFETDSVVGMGPRQAEAMSRLMHCAAAESDPGDWVVPLDADEFVSVDRGNTLRGVLEQQDGPRLLSWRTYVPHELDPGAQNPVERLRHRLREEARPWSKVVVPVPLAARVDLTVGSHGLRSNDESVPALRSMESVRLAHFPIRSPEQYAMKIAIGTLSLMAGTLQRGSMGSHYERAYAQLVRDPSGFAESYQEAAARFAAKEADEFEPELVEDPFAYAGGPLRYTDGLRPAEPLATVLEYAEQLARRVAELTDSG